MGDVGPGLELAAILAGGTVALASHGTKATARLAINASPEPFTNWFSSIGEDLVVFGGIWLTFNHPVVMLALVILFLALAAWLIPKLYRLAKAGFKLLWDRIAGIQRTHSGSPSPPSPN